MSLLEKTENKWKEPGNGPFSEIYNFWQLFRATTLLYPSSSCVVTPGRSQTKASSAVDETIDQIHETSGGFGQIFTVSKSPALI